MSETQQEEAPRRPGRPRTGTAKTGAERQRAYQERKGERAAASAQTVAIALRQISSALEIELHHDVQLAMDEILSAPCKPKRVKEIEAAHERQLKAFSSDPLERMQVFRQQHREYKKLSLQTYKLYCDASDLAHHVRRHLETHHIYENQAKPVVERVLASEARERFLALGAA